ncbi:myosin-M heavy chain-like isoform X2 [Denticeps clupeoides]|uniref:myosin-M heavy chain-like isoform X2 n=1 Tax=Denticeps clupeoides TaxID=299321 RepID=UPI0010A59DD8|nr:myosin-M heavy chain-like isoform X2 [Denticeps clupeoides]
MKSIEENIELKQTRQAVSELMESLEKQKQANNLLKKYLLQERQEKAQLVQMLEEAKENSWTIIEEQSYLEHCGEDGFSGNERKSRKVGHMLPAQGWSGPAASARGLEASSAEKDTCKRCAKLHVERKEAIMEFLNSESRYGEDLRIIMEEFYCPMKTTGQLTNKELAVVFSNVQELIGFNEMFTKRLQESIDQAINQGDENLLTVRIGELFLEFANMLLAFQTYFLQQSSSVNMLNTLEKKNEPMRAPVQRVTRYALLLNLISKTTTECHQDYAHLQHAKSCVESHLEKMDTQSKKDTTKKFLSSYTSFLRRIGLVK